MVSDALGQLGINLAEYLVLDLCLLLATGRHPFSRLGFPLAGRLEAFNFPSGRVFNGRIPTSALGFVRHQVEAKEKLGQLLVSFIRRIIDWGGNQTAGAVPTEEASNISKDPDR